MDFDNDGVSDLILGNRTGTVLFYKRNADLSLQSSIALQDANGMIDVSNNSKPTVIDWDGDGLLDLFVSIGDTLLEKSTGMPIRYYRNEGTIDSYLYGNYAEVTAGGEVLELLRCYTQFTDLNDDGLLDLIATEKDYENLGGGSKIFYYENMGGTATFNFKSAVALQNDEGEDLVIFGDAHFCFADWNGNGAEDLLWTQYPGATAEDYLYVSYRSGITVHTDDYSSLQKNSSPLQLKVSENAIHLLGEKQVREVIISNLSGKTIHRFKSPETVIQLPKSMSRQAYVITVDSEIGQRSDLLFLK